MPSNQEQFQDKAEQEILDTWAEDGVYVDDSEEDEDSLIVDGDDDDEEDDFNEDYDPLEAMDATEIEEMLSALPEEMAPERKASFIKGQMSAAYQEMDAAGEATDADISRFFKQFGPKNLAELEDIDGTIAKNLRMIQGLKAVIRDPEAFLASEEGDMALERYPDLLEVNLSICSVYM